MIWKITIHKLLFFDSSRIHKIYTPDVSSLCWFHSKFHRFHKLKISLTLLRKTRKAMAASSDSFSSSSLIVDSFSRYEFKISSTVFCGYGTGGRQPSNALCSLWMIISSYESSSSIVDAVSSFFSCCKLVSSGPEKRQHQKKLITVLLHTKVTTQSVRLKKISEIRLKWNVKIKIRQLIVH